MSEPQEVGRGNDRLIGLIKLGQLALENASVVVQSLPHQHDTLLSWLDLADNHLRELREALASQLEETA